MAFTGAIKDELLDVENLAIKLVERLNSISKTFIQERYSVLIEKKNFLWYIIRNWRKKEECIIRGGGEIDFDKASYIVLDEFRKGVIGRITLELPIC